MKLALWTTIWLSASATSIAAGGECEFQTKPTATHDGSRTNITFAVSAECDVTVAIVDRNGRIVRHLAGGMLGPNAPAPLAADSLKQTLAWDGRDDLGRPVPDVAACRVQVAAGMRAEFDKILAWSGQEVEDIRGLTCGPDGTLYLFYGGQLLAHRRTTLVSAFDREGRYLRQVMPGPGDLAPKQRAGWPHVELDDGRTVPVVQQALSRSLLPAVWLGDRVFPTVTGDDRLLVLTSPDAGFARTSNPDVRDGRRLLIMGTDGSVPQNFLGPVLADEGVGGFGWIAVSPDGKWVYSTGLGGGKKGRQELPLEHVVHRTPLDGSGKPEVFLGKLHTPGSGAEGLRQPTGIAVDPDGNIYVSDYGNDRIAAFDSQGRFIKAIDVKAPWEVHVGRKSGSIYVIAEDGMKLVKFASLDSTTPAASIPTDATRNEKVPVSTMMALDDSGDQPVVWLAARWWHNGFLHQLIDRGDRFENLGTVLEKRQNQPAMNFTSGLAVAGGRLVTKNGEFGFNYNANPISFDVTSGEYQGQFTRGGNRANEVFAGMDGSFYALGGGYRRAVPLKRFSVDGKPIPFPEAGESVDGFWHGHTRSGGAFVGRQGDIYVIGGDAYRKLDRPTVRHFSAGGELVNDSLVKIDGAWFGGLAVDSRGNIYVGAQVAPKGEIIPKWFDERLPPDTEHHHPRQAYRQYGAIIKFGPNGGAIEPDDDGDYIGGISRSEGPVRLVGAEWLRRGGEVPIRSGDYGAYCHCETSRFGIDGFDRLFVPDLYRFSVRVLDSAGNLIAEIGSYGNMDHRGPDSDHPTPAIAYAWPLAAQVSDGVLYVADVTNRRVVAARLTAAAVETCPIR